MSANRAPKGEFPIAGRPWEHSHTRNNDNVRKPRAESPAPHSPGQSEETEFTNVTLGTFQGKRVGALTGQLP